MRQQVAVACEIRRAATLGIKWECSGRAHATRTAPRGSVQPGPVKSPGALPVMFCDDEEEDEDT